MPRAFFAFPYSFGVDYRIAISRVCDALNVTPIYGDEVIRSDALLSKLQEEIQTCHIGFYDITGLNPNVLIELGMSFASNRPTFVLYDLDRHKKTPAAKLGKFEVPSDIKERAHLPYKGFDELGAEVRKAMRETLQIGLNGHLDLKAKVEKQLRRGRQRISEIAAGIGSEAPRADLEAAIMSLRHEKIIALEGHHYRLT
jgi:hypothetical protein